MQTKSPGWHSCEQVFLLLPDQQGCLQRRFPSGQFSFPTSPLPRRTLHHYRHRSVRWGGGSADRLSLQRGPRIAATHMSSPSSVTGLPGIELSCRAQVASACNGCLHSRTPARMPCASSFPFQTNSRPLFSPRPWRATIRHQEIGHWPGCWDQEEHICLVEDVQERRYMLLLSWDHHTCSEAMVYPPTAGAQAWPMKGAHREERGHGVRE